MKDYQKRIEEILWESCYQPNPDEVKNITDQLLSLLQKEAYDAGVDMGFEKGLEARF
jgi:hypothetical protein